MTWVVVFLSVVCGLVLQSALPAPVWLAQSKWPILLGVVLYYALNRSPAVALGAALLAGLLQDAMSYGPLGQTAVFYAVLAWGLGRFRGLLIGDSPVTAAVVGSLGAAAVVLLAGLLLRGSGRLACPYWWLLMRVLGTLLLGMVSTPIAFGVVGALDRMVGNVEVKAGVGELQ